MLTRLGVLVSCLTVLAGVAFVAAQGTGAVSCEQRLRAYTIHTQRGLEALVAAGAEREAQLIAVYDARMQALQQQLDARTKAEDK